MGNAGSKMEIISIKGMTCEKCVNSIESKVGALKGVENIKVSLKENKAFVKFNPFDVSVDKIKSEIESLGYSAVIDSNSGETNTVDNKTNDKNTGKANIPLIIGIGVIALIVVAALTGGFGLFGPSATGAATGIAKASGEMTIPLSEISEKAKWYEYDSNGVSVSFFAVEADDGSIKTGFDACDVCYGAKKGYSQQGSYMVCNNCGNRYPISGLGTENRNPGGCWPGYLPSSVNGDELVIKNSDLESGRSMFI